MHEKLPCFGVGRPRNQSCNETCRQHHIKETPYGRDEMCEQATRAKLGAILNEVEITHQTACSELNLRPQHPKLHIPIVNLAEVLFQGEPPLSFSVDQPDLLLRPADGLEIVEKLGVIGMT